MHWLVKVFSPPAAGRSQGKLSDAKRKAEGSAWLAGCGFASVLSTDWLLATMGRKDKRING